MPNILLAAAPYLCLLSTIWLIRLKDAATGQPFFAAVAFGAIIWSYAVWLAANILSWLHLLRPFPITAVWLAYLAIVLCFCLKYRRRWKLYRLSGAQWFLAAIFLATLFIGIVYPPNNYDVLTYHMPRVVHWLQNHSMSPYPTSIDRQIGMAPFNAMIAMQSYGASGLDVFANLTQWLAFIGCVLAVMRLADSLGGSHKAVMAAGIFAAALPAAIVQASSTDSCLLVSFYICMCAQALLCWRARPCFRFMFVFGSSLAFAILSKGSAYPILLPFVLIVAWYCLSRPRRLFLQGLMAACLVLTINMPHFIHNFQGTGNVVGSSEQNILSKPAPRLFAGNIIFHFLANEPILLAGHGLETWQKAAAFLGMDSGNAIILPWGGLERIKPYYSVTDGHTPNPVHILLVLAAIAAAVAPRFRPPMFYACAVGASAFLFALVLTWHPWVTRIQISLFMLAAPLCGIFCSRLALIRGASSGLLALSAVWAIAFCVERPLVPSAWVQFYRDDVKHFLSAPRETLLFNYNPAAAQQYRNTADFLAARRIRELGLSLGSNGVEYPIWVLLKNRMSVMPHIAHAINGASPDYIWTSPRQGEGAAESVRIVSGKNGARIFSPAAGQPNRGTSE